MSLLKIRHDETAVFARAHIQKAYYSFIGRNLEEEKGSEIGL